MALTDAPAMPRKRAPPRALRGTSALASGGRWRLRTFRIWPGRESDPAARQHVDSVRYSAQPLTLLHRFSRLLQPIENLRRKRQSCECGPGCCRRCRPSPGCSPRRWESTRNRSLTVTTWPVCLRAAPERCTGKPALVPFSQRLFALRALSTFAQTTQSGHGAQRLPHSWGLARST